MIGAGAVGSSTAWHLANLGYEVILIDPAISKPITKSGLLTGTYASLGILMGYAYRKSSGRGWRLRKRSMELWPDWIKILNHQEYPLRIKTPLIQLASSEQEAIFMKSLSLKRKDLGLEFLSQESANSYIEGWPKINYGGLISYKDGKLDPINLQSCILKSLEKKQVKKISERVINIKRNSFTPNKQSWLLSLENGTTSIHDTVIICSALNSEYLLESLGYTRSMCPVIGQVLELELSHGTPKNWSTWPAVLSIEGINIVPNGTNSMLVGATLEPGFDPNKEALKTMQNLNGIAPSWIQNASIIQKWYGIRARPVNNFSPLLETLENGLIISTGHYRNGILLAPACAEWIGIQINNWNKIKP